MTKMRVVDKLMGLKVACQNQLMHATLLIMLCIVDKGGAFQCSARDYTGAYVMLLITHTFSFIPFSVTIYRFNSGSMSLNLERGVEFISLILYMLTIFYVQDLVNFDIGIAECQEMGKSDQFCQEEFCNLDSLGLFTQILQFEVFMFYVQIGCVCVWQCMQYFGLLKIQGFREDEGLDDMKVDSIETDMVDFMLLSSSFIIATGTLYIIYLQNNLPGYEQIEGSDSYEWGIWTFFSTNILMVIVLRSLMVGQLEGDDEDSCLGTTCIVFMLFAFCAFIGQVIINIVLAVKLGSEDEPLYFYWIVSTTAYLALFITNVGYQKTKERAEMELNLSLRQSKTTVNDKDDDFKKPKELDGEYIKVKKLSIGQDYYSIAFCAQLYRSNRQEPNLGPFDFVKYFYNILFVVFIQLTLLGLATIELTEKSEVSQAHFYILTARFLCALLLHVKVEPEVNQGIQLYRYFVNHSIQWKEEQKLRNKTTDENDSQEEDRLKEEEESNKDADEDNKSQVEKKLIQNEDEIKKLVEETVQKERSKFDNRFSWTQKRFDEEKDDFQFKSYWAACIISLFQFITSFSTECVSLWLIATQNNVMDIIMNFVALAIIAEIDNMFLDAIRDQYLKQYYEDNPEDFEPLIIKKDTEVKMSERPWSNKIHYAFYLLLDFFHMCFYFYFFPFVAIYLNFYVSGRINCEFDQDLGFCTSSPWGMTNRANYDL